METFKSWAVSSVTAAAVVAVISLLAPSGNLEKTMKFIIALFLLTAFILPFSRSDVAADFFDSNNGIKELIDENKLENEVKKQVADSLENAVETEICAYLSGIGIDFVSVEAKVSVDQENNVYTQSINIVLREKTPTYELDAFVSERFGIKPDVKFESED